MIPKQESSRGRPCERNRWAHCVAPRAVRPKRVGVRRIFATRAHVERKVSRQSFETRAQSPTKCAVLCAERPNVGRLARRLSGALEAPPHSALL